MDQPATKELKFIKSISVFAVILTLGLFAVGAVFG